MAKRGPDPPLPAIERQRLYALSLALLCLLVYGQTLSFDFIKLDDNHYVTENAHVLAGLTSESIRWAFAPTGYAANWHPLVWLSLMLDAELFGTWPGGFHFTSAALHTVNSLLVFALLCRLTGERGRSFVVAALFAVHPLHVESVAWISERKDVLSTLFGLLSLDAYARFTERRRIGWYLVAWSCLLLSLMSKQMLVTLPCVLLLLDFWPLERTDFGRGSRNSHSSLPQKTSIRGAKGDDVSLWRLVAEKTPFIALSAAFCAVAVWAQSAGQALHSWDQISPAARLSNAAVSYAVYLGQTAWPTNLAVFYPYPTTGIGLWQVAATALLLVGVTAWTLREWQRRPYLLTGWMWFLVTLLPVIGIIQVGDQARADRYMYFPLIGLSIAGTWLIAEALQTRFQNPRAARVLATAVLLVLGGMAWQQARSWRNSVTLFTRALEVTDDNWLAHATLASALMDRPGQSREAEQHLRESLRIRPNNATAHYNLALVLSDLGDLDQANSHFREALALKPDHIRARLLFCLNLKRLGRFDELSRELAKFDAEHPSPPPEVRSAWDALRSP